MSDNRTGGLLIDAASSRIGGTPGANSITIPVSAAQADEAQALRSRIEELDNHCRDLEAKLAKAVGALHEIAGKKDFADDPWSIARTTLEELKGMTDDQSSQSRA